MTGDKPFKLIGNSRVIEFSPDGKFIFIGDHDGGFKIYDVDKNSISYKTKLRGPKNDIMIDYLGISFDNKYAAFSGLRKVWVVDVGMKDVIWEFEYSENERSLSIPFCFFNQSWQLVIPNGDTLLLYNIESQESHYISLPKRAGWTDCIAISPDDTCIAYKSCNDGLDEEVFVYDVETGKLLYTIHVSYPSLRASQVSISRNMRFVDNDTLLVLRKGIGLSYFNLRSGTEILTRTWEEMGFKTVHSFWNAKVSSCGRYVLFNKETPDATTPPGEWYVTVPDGCEYVLYDIKENNILFRVKLGQSPASFHMERNLFAYIQTEYDDNDRRSKYLHINKNMLG